MSAGLAMNYAGTASLMGWMYPNEGGQLAKFFKGNG